MTLSERDKTLLVNALKDRYWWLSERIGQVRDMRGPSYQVRENILRKEQDEVLHLQERLS